MIASLAKTLRRLRLILTVAAALGAWNAHLIAQPSPATGTLRVTVVDQSGAIIVGATVTVAAADGGTAGVAMAPVPTADVGIAVVPGLAAGRYTVSAAFPGFDTLVLRDVRIRSGDNRQVAVLTIQRLEAAVTVERDRQQVAADRNGPSFGTTLTRDQVDALSDDPSILQQQLQDMAGPGAVIRIDGFEGGALPAKAQIRSIRIARDQFAAEYHSAGGVSIEIITQPGLGPVRYYSFFQARDSSVSGQSPFVPVRGPEQNVNYGFGLGGALIKDKSSFNLNLFGINAYDTPNLNAALPGGQLAQALSVKAPRDSLFLNGQVDYALTLDQTLRFGYNFTRVANDNLGVGGYDAAERGYATENLVHTLRVQHFGPLGRRAFWRSRVQLFVSDTQSQSALEAPTIRVLDAFTTGGAQRAGGNHSTAWDIASDLDYVAGRHSVRAGVILNSMWYHSDATADYLGTYTFDNLTAYAANQPSNYTRRIGDPRIAYNNVQGGLYLQDDIRVRKNLTLTPGVRYERQTHVHDFADIGPRFGMTWAPFASGRTTLRSSVGIFYDWLPATTYDQAVRVDGTHQEEVNIINPAFPGIDISGVVPPSNRYLLGDDYHAPRSTRVSAGIDQTLMKVTRVSATYSYLRGSRLARGLNLNTPIEGVRPDPEAANLIEIVSDAASRLHQVQFDASVNPGAMLPLFSGPRVSWKRVTLFANYTLASLRNNTDGPFSVPPTGDLSQEWGPAAGDPLLAGPGPGVPGVIAFGGNAPVTDVRSRLNLALNNQVVRNFLLAINISSSTAPPYTLQTGQDDNGDGIFNDRPAGASRNSQRASGLTTVNMMAGYLFSFGRAAPLPPGIGIFGSGGATQVRSIDQGTARYRLQLFVQVQNLTNNRNYLGYSGTLTSPFFGRATAVSGMRKMDVGMNLNF